jgi:hypothetical protein
MYLKTAVVLATALVWNAPLYGQTCSGGAGGGGMDATGCECNTPMLTEAPQDRVASRTKLPMGTAAHSNGIEASDKGDRGRGMPHLEAAADLREVRAPSGR